MLVRLLIDACLFWSAWPSDRVVMAKLVEFSAYVMSNHASWRYIRPSTKWLLGCRSLRVLVTLLRDLEVSQATEAPRREGTAGCE